MEKYDVFISYRRDGGDQTAKVIYDRLKDMGYHTFYDIETLRSGAFNTKLYSVIEKSNDVLVILSPGALDRCVNEDDWVRLEIAHAFQENKNVVPILLRGFTFPDSLPEDIDKIRYQGGIQASVEFFDAFVDRLTTFLTSKPDFIRKVNKNLTLRKVTAAVLICALLILGVWGGYTALWSKTLASGYPVTRQQKNDVKQFLFYIENNMTVMDNMFQAMETTFTACEDYLNNREENSYQELVAQIDHATETLETQSSNLQTLPSEVSATMGDSEVDMADAQAFYTFAQALKDDSEATLNFLKDAMNPDNILDDTTLNRLLEIYKELNNLSEDSVMISTCDLLVPIKSSTLEEFRTDYLPSLYVLSTKIDQWTTDEVAIKSKSDSIVTQQDKLLNEYSQLVGSQNVELMSDQSDLIEMLVTEGMSEEDAKAYVESIIDKTQANKNAEKELEELQAQLGAEKQKLRDKFAPQESDDPYLVWGKALRFLTVHMYEDAIDAFQFHLMQVKDTDENAQTYVAAAISFVNQMGTTGIDYGVLVVGYEPGKAPHTIYKIGDIIVAVNDTPCRNFEEFDKLRKEVPKGSDYTATILRADEKGTLVLTNVVVPDGQPKIALLDMTEEASEQ